MTNPLNHDIIAQYLLDREKIRRIRKAADEAFIPKGEVRNRPAPLTEDLNRMIQEFSGKGGAK